MENVEHGPLIHDLAMKHCDFLYVFHIIFIATCGFLEGASNDLFSESARNSECDPDSRGPQKAHFFVGSFLSVLL